MPGSNGTRQHTIAAVIGNRLSPFEFSVLCEVFGERHLGVPWYRLDVCSPDPSPVSTVIPGMKLTVPYGLSALRRADTIVVPVSGLVVSPPPALLSALRRAHARGARIVSLCTGAFVLAAAGLLDGRTVTTHWRHADALAQRYPLVKVDSHVLYVDDGDILTSAGSAASIDLSLHIVRQDFGAEIANAVARAVVVPPHRDGGQAQFIDQPISPAASDHQFAKTLDWIQANLHDTLSVEMLARHSSMSLRTFARRFTAATGTTPHRWILSQRLLEAQRLLVSLIHI